MRLSVATNFDPELVERCRDYPVTELFGKLQIDVVGGGRAPYQLAKVSRRQLEDHVRHVHKSGMAFNYLLNSSCMGNREITRKGQKDIEELLGWVSGHRCYRSDSRFTFHAAARSKPVTRT